ERVNEAVHVGGVQVGLLIPGGGGQHNVGVKCRGVHPEVQINNKVHLSLRCRIPPDDFLHRIFGDIGGDGVGVSAEIVFEEIFVPLGAGHERVAPPDKPH